MAKPRILVTGNWLRTAAQFLITPFSQGFNFDRYNRELRSPFPAQPQFAPDSKIWEREHGVADDARPATPERDKGPVATTSYGSKTGIPIRRYSSCHNK